MKSESENRFLSQYIKLRKFSGSDFRLPSPDTFVSMQTYPAHKCRVPIRAVCIIKINHHLHSFSNQTLRSLGDSVLGEHTYLN